MTCTDLLSSDFSNAIQEAFEFENRRKHIEKVTRPYRDFACRRAGYRSTKLSI